LREGISVQALPVVHFGGSDVDKKTNWAADPSAANSMSAKFRQKRSRILKALMRDVHQRKGGPIRIADLGGTTHYWRAIGLDFLEEVDAHIVCFNIAGEDSADIRCSRISTVTGDACNLDCDDDSFDLVHSNSVIEHVGRFSGMIAFAGEVRRLAPAYFVQTPNYWFPVDPHFHRLPALHWLPNPVQVALLHRFRLGHAAPTRNLATTMIRFESRSMLTPGQFRYLFDDAEIRFERVFGLAKSMIAIRRQRQPEEATPAAAAPVGIKKMARG
jgi:hypothetical protein